MSAREYYHASTLLNPTREQILAGDIIKINPALITLIDGLVGQKPVGELQALIFDQVSTLLAHKIRTFHVDVIYPEYRSVIGKQANTTSMIFTADFVTQLNRFVRAKDGFINLHLVTTFPYKRLRAFERSGVGAICFQLDSIPNRGTLIELMARIIEMDALPSPVIETVGTQTLAPKSPAEVFDFLKPVLSQAGMLTFQAARTGSRSNQPEVSFALDTFQAYLAPFQNDFKGTCQVQGGITTDTIGAAVTAGAEFLVCGTQIFHNTEGIAPTQVIDQLLEAAADALEL